MDLRQTKEYAKYMKSSSWDVQKVNNEYIFTKRVPLLGNMSKLQRPKKPLKENEILEFIEKNDIKVFSYEPSINSSLPSSFNLSNSPYLPTKTIILNLNNSLRTLLKNMHQKTRYNIGLSKRKGITIKQSTEVDLFANLWQESALKRGLFLSQKKAIKNLFVTFDKKAHLYFAYQKENQGPVAGLLILDSNDTSYYMYAFTTDKGKKLFAPSLLTWQAIVEAKKRKLRVFDFDGIYDERFPQTTKQWKGFTRFKEGFGGKVLEFPRALVYYKYSFLAFLNL